MTFLLRRVITFIATLLAASLIVGRGLHVPPEARLGYSGRGGGDMNVSDGGGQRPRPPTAPSSAARFALYAPPTVMIVACR